MPGPLPGPNTVCGDKDMTLLPAILVLLLGAFVVWFFWPVVVDPIARGPSGRSRRTEADTLAEDLFDAWSKHERQSRILVPSRHS